MFVEQVCCALHADKTKDVTFWGRIIGDSEEFGIFQVFHGLNIWGGYACSIGPLASWCIWEWIEVDVVVHVETLVATNAMHIEESRRLICDETNKPIDKVQILFQEFGDYMIFRI